MPNRPRTLVDTVTMSPGAAAAFASLQTEVGTLQGDFTDIKSTIAGFDRKIDAGLAAINAKLDERGRFQWGPIGALAGTMVGVVALFWQVSMRPTDTAIQRLETLTSDMSRSFISREEVRTGRERFDRDLKILQDQVVPRGEHAEKWRANDTAFVTVQRQIDDIRKESGATYTLRDKVMDLNKRLDEVNGLLMRSTWAPPK